MQKMEHAGGKVGGVCSVSSLEGWRAGELESLGRWLMVLFRRGRRCCLVAASGAEAVESSSVEC